MRKFMLMALAITVLVSCNPKNAEEAKTGDAKKVSEASGEKYLVQTEKSTVHWRGTKPSGEHVGTVGITKGELTLTEGEVTGGMFVIDLNSIVNTDQEGEWNAKLVGHLKSEDFFHTSEFPEATFEIVSVDEYKGEEASEGVSPSHSITGNLTMRGETKSITFPASVHMHDGSVHAQSNEFSIDRTLWGVNFKSKSVFAEIKDDFIGDMINLKLDVVFSAS